MMVAAQQTAFRRTGGLYGERMDVLPTAEGRELFLGDGIKLNRRPNLGSRALAPTFLHRRQSFLLAWVSLDGMHLWGDKGRAGE